MAKQAKQPAQNTQKPSHKQAEKKSLSHNKQYRDKEMARRGRVPGAVSLYVNRQMQSLFSNSAVVQSYVGHLRRTYSSKW